MIQAKEWENTTISKGVIKDLLNKNLRGVTDRLLEAGRAIAQAQAAVAFRDGKKEGRREVVEDIIREIDEAPLGIRLATLEKVLGKWQTQLKERGKVALPREKEGVNE